jgi:hypothetical protein
MFRLGRAASAERRWRVTAAEWEACSEVFRMLSVLSPRVSERTCRLFAAACCCSIWHLLEDEHSRPGVEAVER